MNIPAYLSRINYDKPVMADISTLCGLQTAHMLTVPFENLDIGLKCPLRIDVESLRQKIVINRRGGFCYELNGLFAWLLKAIGFDVTYLNARDYNEVDGSFGIDFDHLVLLVCVAGESTRWLVDVGWGDTFTQPLDIDYPDEQVQGLRGYWLEPFKDGYQLWQRNFEGSRERQYYFDLTAHSFPSEYEATCLYHQTSPKSIFTQKRITTRLTEEGRISLDHEKLIVTKNGAREVRLVAEEERPSLLLQHFGIT
ncbi:MAG: arylamine N-acetyltransferase, partial [Chloroflexota bacterium]